MLLVDETLLACVRMLLVDETLLTCVLHVLVEKALLESSDTVPSEFSLLLSTADSANVSIANKCLSTASGDKKCITSRKRDRYFDHRVCFLGL